LATVVVDGSDEVASVPEAEGARADQLDLVIHAFETISTPITLSGEDP
jgi:hypothetical protein